MTCFSLRIDFAVLFVWETEVESFFNVMHSSALIETAVD